MASGMLSEQLRADGTLRHLLTLETLPPYLIERLLERSQSFVRPLGERPAMSQTLQGFTVANLFTEPSTRTRVSFELAAKRLGAQTVNLEVQLSSRAKGESMLDTVSTLQSLYVDAFVIRDAEAGVPHLVAANVAPHVSVLSAGEAHLSHPTQGLLDALTIKQRKGRFAGLAVAIVGDVRNSRVARSNVKALTALGCELTLVGPPTLMPERLDGWPVQVQCDLDDVLADVDVLYVLRIQRERIGQALFPSLREYAARWGLTAARASRLKPDTLVMHPGPMNRGVEIAGEVADSAQSLVTEQVANGVAVRMAVLWTLLGSGGPIV